MATEFDILLPDFLAEAKERIDQVEVLLMQLREVEPEVRKDVLVKAKRELHTLKGNAGMMGLKDLQVRAHLAEDIVSTVQLATPDVQDSMKELDQLRLMLKSLGGEAPSAKEQAATEGSAEKEVFRDSIRVPFRELDELMDLLSQMVIFRNRLFEALSETEKRYKDSMAAEWVEVLEAQQSLAKTLAEIQMRVMHLRMIPLKSGFAGLKRIVYDECVRTRKEAGLGTEGGDTPIDKAVLESAQEALGHLVRNAVIHGVESQEKRKEAGKQPAGSIHISSKAQDGEIIIDVKDDGAGIDREALLKRAAKEGISVDDPESVYDLLFLPGITTREKSDLSAGRGMGLSAALEAVQEVGGRIEVLSYPRQGSLFRLHLPLNISVAKSLVLQADGESYALPLSSAVDSFRLHAGDAHMLNQALVLRWREDLLPLLDLGYTFGTATTNRNSGVVVVLNVDNKKRGLIADDILGIREIVVKRLDPMVGHPQGISGSTILGNGQVALILDPYGLMSVKPFIQTI